MPQAYFIREAYFTLRRNISLVPQGTNFIEKDDCFRNRLFLVRMFIRDLINTPERTIIFQKTHIFHESSFAVQCTCKGGFCIMKVKDVKHKVTLDDFEHRLLVGCVNAARTMYLEHNKPTEDVDDLLVKIIKAPSKKVSVRV